MTNNKYFEKTGKIYGASYKNEFGRWTGYMKEFSSMAAAQGWLSAEEYDFRTRELGSRTRCMKLIGA